MAKHLERSTGKGRKVDTAHDEPVLGQSGLLVEKLEHPLGRVVAKQIAENLFAGITVVGQHVEQHAIEPGIAVEAGK